MIADRTRRSPPKFKDDMLQPFIKLCPKYEHLSIGESVTANRGMLLVHHLTQLAGVGALRLKEGHTSGTMPWQVLLYYSTCTTKQPVAQ